MFVNFCTNGLNLPRATSILAGHPQAMLTRLYIEALLVDEELADWVWEAWDAGKIDETMAVLAWWIMSNRVLE